jgi:hypothetical protein
MQQLQQQLQDEEHNQRENEVYPPLEDPRPSANDQVPTIESVTLPSPTTSKKTKNPVARMSFQQRSIKGIDIKNHRHHVGAMIQCPFCKAWMWIQERVKRTPKKAPQFSVCCRRGQIILPDIKPLPRLLDLVSGTARENKNFRQNVRKINAALSFTSMGVKLNNELANARNGVYTYQIHGVVVHRMGSLLPIDGQPEQFAQIYIRDPQFQAERRAGIFENSITVTLLRELQELFEEMNVFCRTFKSIRQRDYGDNIESLRIHLKAKPRLNGQRQRQYDLPTSDEIAVLIPGQETIAAPRDIIIEGKSGNLMRIDQRHIMYDPLQYILLHPRGENGWTFKTYQKRPPPTQCE